MEDYRKRSMVDAITAKYNWESFTRAIRRHIDTLSHYHIITLLTLLTLGCSKSSRVGEEITRIDSTRNTIYIATGQSSISIINSGDSTRCYDVKSVQYNIVNIAPDGEWINYIARESSSTLTCDGQEGQQRTIVIELNPVDRPNHTSYVIKHDADEIVLEHDYYQTVFYGCCDAEPVRKIYDYHNNLMLEGTARILTGAIPNNSLKFFVGYKPSTADTSMLGSIYLVFDPDTKYQVDIMSTPLPLDKCSLYSPVISLASNNRYDTLDVYEDEYQLWDLEPIETIDQIGGISINVQHQCDEYFPVDPVVIPISRGKPFGKDSAVQKVVLVKGEL